MTPIDPSVSTGRPLVVVAKSSIDAASLSDQTRSLLSASWWSTGRPEGQGSHVVDAIRDTLRVFEKGGYDTTLHPLRHHDPHMVVMDLKSRTRRKDRIREGITSILRPLGISGSKSSVHASSIELPLDGAKMPSRQGLHDLMTRVLSARILDAEGLDRLVMALAAITAVRMTSLEDHDCFAPCPWFHGRCGIIDRKPEPGTDDPGGCEPMDQEHLDLLPDIVMIWNLRHDHKHVNAERPVLLLMPLILTIDGSNMPDPITAIRTLERLRAEPIA